MATLVPSFLIGSSSVLQVMRTGIKARVSLNFSPEPQLSTELGALERLKNPCLHIFSVAINPILFKLADKEAMHKALDEFKFLPDSTTDNRVSYA